MRNLIGKQVGRLTIVSKANKLGGRLAWLCQCSCGTRMVVEQHKLIKYSPTLSCGCFSTESRTKNLTGHRYGLWTVEVLSRKKKQPNGGCYWSCLCDCGTKRDVSSDSLLGGRSISCGCSKARAICPQGHDTLTWGRDKSGFCRACIKNRNFIRNYGITLAQYLSLWEYQDGKCAICKSPVSVQLGRPGYSTGCRAELDHEHNNDLPKKEQVRGILCGGRWSGCNRKLGRIDKLEWLRAVVEYIANPPARELFKKMVYGSPEKGISPTQ